MSKKSKKKTDNFREIGGTCFQLVDLNLAPPELIQGGYPMNGSRFFRQTEKTAKAVLFCCVAQTMAVTPSQSPGRS